MNKTGNQKKKKQGWRSGKTRWTEKRKWKEMEKGLMNGKFTFKTLPDGSVDRTKVICTYCRHEMSYHWSTSSLRYHLQAKHTADAESPPPKADITMFWSHLGWGDTFEPFIFLHDLKCWIKMFIKQAYLLFLMLSKVLRTWTKYIKVHLEQEEICQKKLRLIAS